MQIRSGELLESMPKVSGAGIGNQSISRELTVILENAIKEAGIMKDEYVSVEHMLIALSDSKNSRIGELLQVRRNNERKYIKSIKRS